MYRLTCVSKRKEASFLKGETMRENQNKEHLKLVRQAVRGNPEAYGRLISEYQEYSTCIKWRSSICVIRKTPWIWWDLWC